MNRIVQALALATLFVCAPTPARADAPKVAAPSAPAVKEGASSSSFASQPKVGTKARCAVAGEEFVVKAKTMFSTHEGRVYAFCCADCKPDFDKNPAKYADKK